jgi:hypothetical protein
MTYPKLSRIDGFAIDPMNEIDSSPSSKESGAVRNVFTGRVFILNPLNAVNPAADFGIYL